MKCIAAIFAAGLMLLVYSCNNSGNKKEEPKVADSVIATTPAATELVFQPFKIIMIQHAVKDYVSWKAAYLAHDSMRMAYGISSFILGRGMIDTNVVMIMDKISDVAKAKEFSASPNLREAMQKAGVNGKPIFAYVDVIRHDAAKTAQKDRLMITHKVKDFDAWLKVYDAEGKAKRMEYGLTDRALGRGVDDPNMIYTVFVISDMAKAKARLASEELKKLMTDAGVEGQPELTFYRADDR